MSALPRTGSSARLRTSRAGQVLAGIAVALFGSLTLPSAAHAASNATNATVNGAQVFYTWVEAGETFSSVFTEAGQIFSGSGDPVVTVVRPDATTDVCTNITVGAPFGQVCEFSEVAPVSGVYAVQLATTTPDRTFFNAPLRWSITASDETGVVPGRTWSNDFLMRNENTAFVPELNLWVQTEFGYTYAITMRELHGINSRYNMDAFGVVDTNTCVTARQSAAFTANDFPNLRNVVGSECEFTPYKVFFEAPASDLPEAVTLPGGEQTWLLRAPQEPVISQLDFDSAAPGAAAGTVTYAIQRFEGTAVLAFDLNGDGQFDGPEDRQEPVAVTSDQPASFAFDGLDGQGQPIEPYTNFTVRLFVERAGEVHFTLDDIELLAGGVSITRLNGPSGGETLLYWDDQPLTDIAFDAQANIKCSTTPVLTSLPDGIDSTAGVHGWGFGDCPDVNSLNSPPTDLVNGGSWGNNRLIDNWTFVDVNLARELLVEFEVPPTDPPTTGEPTEEPTTGESTDVPTTDAPTSPDTPAATTPADGSDNLAATGVSGLTTAIAAGLIALFIGSVLVLLARRRHP